MNELLLKYISGNCTEAEKVTITEWLDADPANMKEYLALRKLNELTIWNSEISFGSEKQTKKKRIGRKIFFEAAKIAAILAVAFFVSNKFFPNVIFQSPDIAMQTIYVPAGQRAELTLKDGTKVWLNAKTTLEFPETFTGKTRNVKLDGEGFFEVATDKSKPFIVNTEKYDVRVWGTKFNLMAYSQHETFETSLIEGAVEVLKQGMNNGVMLKPNERIYSQNGSMIIAPITNTDNFLWKEGIINFDNLTFAQLTSKLELYFDIEFEVKNSRLMNSHYTGKFRTKDGVKHILEVLQIKNRFRYSIDEKLNKITIE